MMTNSGIIYLNSNGMALCQMASIFFNRASWLACAIRVAFFAIASISSLSRLNLSSILAACPYVCFVRLLAQSTIVMRSSIESTVKSRRFVKGSLLYAGQSALRAVQRRSWSSFLPAHGNQNGSLDKRDGSCRSRNRRFLPPLALSNPDCEACV